MQSLKSLLVIAFVFGLTMTAYTQDADKKKDEVKKPKIETVEASIKNIEVFDIIDGILEASDTTEIKTDFEAWTDLKVKAVENQGSRVVENSILITFDKESIDKAIVEAEFAHKTAELVYEDAKLAMKEINETLKLDQDIAERTWKNAQDDYDYYKTVLLPQRMDDLDYNEKTAGYYLEYSKDELDQLEQMYQEDELTEESEAIVLKRAKRDVESATRSKDRSMRSITRSREFEVPREKQTRDDQFQREKLEFDKSKVTLPIKKQRAEIALMKAEFDLKNKKQKLDELVADKAKMRIAASAAGVLYFGQCVNGKWLGPTGTASRDIKVDSKLAANKVIMTIVNPTKMFVRANLTEEQLGYLRPGMKGNALVKVGSQVIPVSIDSISGIPMGAGTFDCKMTIGQLPDDGNIMPGMTCKTSFQTFADENAVVVPKASVFSDDGGITNFVFVVEDDEATRKTVKLGRTVDTDVVILDGLAAGDKIAKKR